MPINYSISLLLLSTIAASVTIFICFGVLDRFYRASDKVKGFAPIIISTIIGGGIFSNHFLILLSSNLGTPTSFSWSILHGLLFASAIGACFVFISVTRKPLPYQFLIGGLIAGICDFGLFYSSQAAIHGIEAVSVNPVVAAVGTLFSTVVITFGLLQFQWVKNYAGKHKRLNRALVAVGLSLGALSIHFILDNAFTDSNLNVLTVSHSPQSTAITMTAIALALGMVCLILCASLFVLLYEKNGKKIFNLYLSRSNPKPVNDIDSLQDSLTKLPNRRAFDSHLESAQKRSQRSGRSFALAYIDLDHFKPINDDYGHHIGDAVLTITAERLNMAIRGCDFVARIGGDEFIAILEEVDTEEDVRPIANRIVDSIKESYFIDHLNIEISCSVGVALHPKDSDDDLEKLMVCADAAMYKAKDQGKNQFKFYDAEIESANDMLINLQSELCTAIENKEFSIAYLPKINCHTLTAVGAEALIRWNHPTKGEIQPNDFLPAAEHFGLIQEINNWVIDECCSMLAHAKQANLDLTVSVNLSSHQFRDPNLVKNIIKTINYYDLAPSQISFEIKETVAINNQKQFKLLLDKFKAAGIKVILDDFGLLPMSLTYLLDLNIDEVKIDKSFIAMINKDQNAHALIDAIFKLTHALGFKATAEGIEDEAQQDTIIDLGCDYMQGYLFSKPVREAELFQLYQKLQFKQLQIDFGSAASKEKRA